MAKDTSIEIPQSLEEWVHQWLFDKVTSAPIDLDTHVRVTTFCRAISYDLYRHLSAPVSSPSIETDELQKVKAEATEYRKALNDVSTRLVGWEIYGDDLNGGTESHSIQKLLDKYSTTAAPPSIQEAPAVGVRKSPFSAHIENERTLTEAPEADNQAATERVLMDLAWANRAGTFQDGAKHVFETMLKPEVAELKFENFALSRRLQDKTAELEKIEKMYQNDPFHFLLSNAIRLLSIDQMEALANELYERTTAIPSDLSDPSSKAEEKTPVEEVPEEIAVEINVQADILTQKFMQRVGANERDGYAYRYGTKDGAIALYRYLSGKGMIVPESAENEYGDGWNWKVKAQHLKRDNTALQSEISRLKEEQTATIEALQAELAMMPEFKKLYAISVLVWAAHNRLEKYSPGYSIARPGAWEIETFKEPMQVYDAFALDEAKKNENLQP